MVKTANTSILTCLRAEHPRERLRTNSLGKRPMRDFRCWSEKKVGFNCLYHRTAGHLEPRRVCLSVFVPLTAHCHPARQYLKKRIFFWRFCSVRKNASLRRTFCCVVHQKRDFKAHPAVPVASTTLLVGSFQLAAGSRLSTHSPSTLDLDSLSGLGTRDPATACVDSEASS